jgi:hypothetical protein
VRGYERLAQSTITEDAEGLLTEAFNFVYPSVPKPQDSVSIRRMGVATLAVATSEGDEWRQDFLAALHAQRHFEVHCLLQSHVTAGRLRKPYGTEIERITPEQARARAVHWREIRGEWCWPHFMPRELASKESGLVYVEPHLLDYLERLREMNGGHALMLTSAYRTPERNAATPGAAPGSKHMLGQAVDMRVSNVDPIQLIQCAEECGFPAIAQYADARVPRVHLDVRPQGSWIAAPMGAFDPDKDYINSDEERVTEPPADKAIGGAVGAGGVATAGAILEATEGGVIEAATDIVTTLTRFAEAVGQQFLPIAAACVALYSGWQYRRQIIARVMAAVGKTWSGS